MLHNNNIYYFIDNFDKDEINSLNKNINLIFRNYDQKKIEQTIKKLSYFCKFHKKKLFIANNLKLALKYNLDGIYIPSFNKNLNFKNLSLKNTFEMIGSAHNIAEIKIKEKQGCNKIFLAPIFYNKKNKSFLEITKFSHLSQTTKIDIIALGGINKKNLRRLRITKALGFAGISYFKKKALS